MKTVQILILGILIGLLAGALVLVVSSEPRGEAIKLVPPVTPSEILIYISGAINNPGVYRLAPDSRVEQAVEVAGGLSVDADTSHANLAARISDGDQVYIPKIGDAVNSAGEVAGNPLPSQKVNINTATLEELDGIPGIGTVKAQSIITYRESHGVYISLDDLLNVPGIGPALLEQIKPYITIE
jgi:competence protein ComEA